MTNLLVIPICNLIVMPAALATLVLIPFGTEGSALSVMGPGLEMMEILTKWVTGIEGAASRVPAMSTMAISLIIAGGLWLYLLSCRWRHLGVLATALSAAVAPLVERPDVLIGDSGRLVMVRDADGEFSGLTS